MRSPAAIVQPADRIVDKICAAASEVREADVLAEKSARQAETARDVAARKRLALGKLLIEARGNWPRSGPRAKGWGELLSRAGLDEATAWRYMKLAATNQISFTDGDAKEKAPTYADLGLDNRPRVGAGDEEPHPPVDGCATEADSVEIISHGSVPAAPDRGAWCTPRAIAAAVGGWDLDPFSNPRSAIIATTHCMLEYGDDGLPDGPPGSYRTSAKGPAIAGPDTRVWIQPPYSIVLEAIAHYGHTRFCALLRLDPSTEWFDRLWEKTALILVPKGDRLEFIPPPGVEASSNPFPHCLFYARAEDATEAIRALCYEWRVRG
jgi:hypothetical protein